MTYGGKPRARLPNYLVSKQGWNNDNTNGHVKVEGEHSMVPIHRQKNPQELRTTGVGKSVLSRDETFTGYPKQSGQS